MADIDAAIATQLANIKKKTGSILTATGLVEQTYVLAYAKKDLALGHGDANMLVLHVRKADVPKPTIPPMPFTPGRRPPSARSTTSFWLRWPRSARSRLRRRSVKIGLNMPTLDGGPRLEAVLPGGMCPYRVKVTAAEEIDKELLDWTRRAYDAAG